MDLNEDERRLSAARAGVPWRTWRPYLSERQWGTVREDYSDNGDAWSYRRIGDQPLADAAEARSARGAVE